MGLLETAFILKIMLWGFDERRSKLTIPKELLGGKIPCNAVYDPEQHFEYIIKKYGFLKSKNAIMRNTEMVGVSCI